MDGWKDEWMNGWMDEWMDGWMDLWMDGWMDVWMDGWMDGWIMNRETLHIHLNNNFILCKFKFKKKKNPL